MTGDGATISRSGSRKAVTGPPQWFTGHVSLENLVTPKEPSRVAAASVTFSPGARTFWHSHPLGQTLIVTAGVGLHQVDGGAVHEIRPGDVISILPGQKHWHGASPHSSMTHIAVHVRLV